MYSFSMIAYQLFELQPPFAGMDPVDAARKAALAEERPALIRLNAGTPTMKARLTHQLLGPFSETSSAHVHESYPGNGACRDVGSTQD